MVTCYTPNSCASTAACTRLRSSSFARRRLTWVFTVASAMSRRVAISALDIPSPRQESTSRSRRVRASRTAGSGPGSRTGLRGELGDQPAGDRGSDQPLAARDRADRLQEGARLGVLQQEPGGARAQRPEDVLVEVEGGEDEYVGQLLVDDLAGGRDAVEPGHLDVHQDEIRPESTGRARPPARRPRPRRPPRCRARCAG